MENSLSTHVLIYIDLSVVDQLNQHCVTSFATTQYGPTI